MVTKLGVHVNQGSRIGYGSVAEAGPAVVTSLEAGAFDDLPDWVTKIWRTQSIPNHKDVPGDIDHLTEERAYAAGAYWGAKLWVLFEPVHRRYTKVFLAPTNETGATGNVGDSEQANRNMAAYTRGLIDYFTPKGVKLALWACAGDNPNWEQWLKWVVPTLQHAVASGGGHIYKRHAYGGVPLGRPKALTHFNGELSGDNPARPFKEAIYLAEQGINIPIVIGEAGQNGGVGFMGVGEAMRDYRMYDAICCQPEHWLIIGFCAWTYGDWHSHNPNIQDASASLTRYLNEHIAYTLADVQQRINELVQPEQPMITIHKDDGIFLSTPHGHHLSQRDPRWAGIDLDGKVGGRSIGDWFCLGVAYNMLARLWKLSEQLPGHFHTAMREADAMSGEVIVPGALKKMFPNGVTYDGYMWRTDDRMRPTLRRYLDAGVPVIGRVDFTPSTAPVQQHWVLIVGENSRNELLCIDPWTGELVNINQKYARAGSDVDQILLYRPFGSPRPGSKGASQGGSGGGMDLAPALRDFPLIIDVSEHRPNVPLIGLNKQGVYGIRLRISTGLRLDKSFHAYMREIARALVAGEELAITGYHDLDERYDIEKQATVFQSGLGSYHTVETADQVIPLWRGGWAVSAEPINGVRSMPDDHQVGQFIASMDRRIGRRDRELYSSKHLIDAHGIQSHGSALWIAAYYKADVDPALPAEPFTDQYTDKSWFVHQFTDTHRIEGYPAGVDCNYFNGTLDELRTYMEVGWLVQLTDSVPVELPSEPLPVVVPEKLHDLWAAMTQNIGRAYMVDVFDEHGNKVATERYQNVLDGNNLYKIKNGHEGPWEHYRLGKIMVDGHTFEVIRLIKDCSPENYGNVDCHYEVTGGDGKEGGIWAARYMADGDVFIEPWTHTVLFVDSENGADYGDPRTGVNRNVCKLFAAESLSLHFGNPAGEQHRTLTGYGVVGWDADWGSASLSTDDPGDYNNTAKTIVLSNGYEFTPPVFEGKA